jgi:hypothetical protein
MTTPEAVVTVAIFVLSFIGIAVGVVVRRSARRIPPDLDPRYDDSE